MKRKVHKALWQAHAGAGALLGTIIFALFVTGSVSVFREEIRSWASLLAPLHTPTEGVLDAGQSCWPVTGKNVAKVLGQLQKEHPLHEIDRWALRLPAQPSGDYELLYRSPGHAHVTRAHVDAQSGRSLGVGKRAPGDFIFGIHANLSLRGKLGRLLVGLLGLLCSVLLGTGLWIHRHKLRNAFTLRWSAKTRKGRADLHRLLGLWTAPFLLMIALTGAGLGLRSLLVNAPALFLYRGDVALAQRALRPDKPSPGPRKTSMQPLALLWEQALVQAKTRLADQERFVPTMLNVTGWSHERARFALSGAVPGTLTPQNEGLRVELEGETGSLVQVESGLEHRFMRRTLDAMTPLHYGQMGQEKHHVWLQVLYACSGLLGAALVGAGLWLWAGKKAPAPPAPKSQTRA